MIDSVLTLMKEPVDPNHVLDLAAWSRAEILSRLCMSQDEIQLDLPGLFKTRDTSLSTIVGQMEYVLPTTIGVINSVSLDGVQLVRTTRDAIIGDAIRGDLVDSTEYVQDWASIQDQPYQFYQDIHDGVAYLGLYPKPSSPAGQTIMIEGELVLANMTDSATSYPLDNLEALRKAQKILIYKTAEVCAIEDMNSVYATYLHQAADKMIEALRTYWFVMRPSDPQSTILYKECEGPSTQTLRRETR